MQVTIFSSSIAMRNSICISSFSDRSDCLLFLSIVEVDWSYFIWKIECGPNKGRCYQWPLIDNKNSSFSTYVHSTNISLKNNKRKEILNCFLLWNSLLFLWINTCMERNEHSDKTRQLNERHMQEIYALFIRSFSKIEWIHDIPNYSIRSKKHWL